VPSCSGALPEQMALVRIAGSARALIAWLFRRHIEKGRGMSRTSQHLQYTPTEVGNTRHRVRKESHLEMERCAHSMGVDCDHRCLGEEGSGAMNCLTKFAD
jgi:hypothetical protein